MKGRQGSQGRPGAAGPSGAAGPDEGLVTANGRDGVAPRPGHCPLLRCVYLEDFTEPATALGRAARPASNLATGTRKGEHDT